MVMEILNTTYATANLIRLAKVEQIYLRILAWPSSCVLSIETNSGLSIARIKSLPIPN